MVYILHLVVCTILANKSNVYMYILMQSTCGCLVVLSMSFGHVGVLH